MDNTLKCRVSFLEGQVSRALRDVNFIKQGLEEGQADTIWLSNSINETVVERLECMASDLSEVFNVAAELPAQVGLFEEVDNG